MKALKEKRVSLRSLFRRSLVILSLFALVFAMGCGESSGGDDPGTDPGPGPTNPAETPPIVTSMTIIQNPVNPSYEGAAPDLTGLQVLVYFNKGDPVIETDISKFSVLPPVAFVRSPGTNEGFSQKGDYGIQYKASDLYNPNMYRENIYIPAVVAVSTGNGTISGTLPEVYEDLGVDAKSLTFTATYNALSGIPTTWPNDTAYTSASFPAANWTVAAGSKGKSISSSPEAWTIEAQTDTGSGNPAYATYFPNLGADSSTTLAPIQVPIDAFYYIDRFEYLSGAEKIAIITADDTAYKGNASVTGPAWWKALYAARDSLKFQVTYYIKEGTTGTPKKTRPITMYEYTKAMYTTDKAGNPKATMPIQTGATPGAAYDSDAYNSVVNEFNLSLQLFYYDRLIIRDPVSGLGTVDLENAPPADQYVKPNVAIIPISENNLIWIYRDLGIERKDLTDHTGEPYIVSNAANNAQNLYSSLMTYYQPYWYYVNPSDDKVEPMKVKFNWPAFTSTSGTNGYLDFENDPLEEGTKEGREATVTLAGPLSNSSELEEATFNFYMLP